MSTPSWSSSSRRATAPERGAGVVATTIGAAAFLVLVLFAAHVVLGLYTTSVVTAVTYDAASEVAAADGPGAAGAVARAEAQARRQLGAYGRDAAFRWDLSPDEVALTVQARRPSVLPRMLVGGTALGDIERTVRVRVEKVR